MTNTIVFDLDNTLFNFDESEKQSIQALFRLLRVSTPANENALLASFLSENARLWAIRDEIGINAVFDRTIEHVFANELSHYQPPVQPGQTYLQCFSQNVVLEQGAQDLVRALAKTCDLYVISNGLKDIQKERLMRSGLSGYFSDVVISGDIGYSKPGREIFDYLITHNGLTRESLVYVGDSIRDDYHGAKNAGLKFVFYNRKNVRLDDISCLQVSSLTELPALLNSENALHCES